MKRWRLPPWRWGLAWLLGLGGLQWATSALAGWSVTASTHALAGTWPQAERFAGTVDLLSRDPGVLRISVILPLFTATAWAVAGPAIAARFVAGPRRGQDAPTLPWLALYCQAAWHVLARVLIVLALATLLGGFSAPPIALGLAGGVATVVSVLAHDRTRARLLRAPPPSPAWHPQAAWEGYRGLLTDPWAALLAGALVALQVVLGVLMVDFAARGLGDLAWRWAVRGLAWLGIGLGLVRLWGWGKGDAVAATSSE